MFSSDLYFQQKRSSKLSVFHQLITRDVFPAANIRKGRFRKVSNVWIKSHFNNFELGWRTFPWSPKCWWFLNRYKDLLGPSKLKSRACLEKYSKLNLTFQNWSKALWSGIFEQTKRLAVQSVAYALLNRQGKQVFVRENEKFICVKELWICKILEIYGWIFFPTKDFSQLESCQLYIISKYKSQQLL